MSSFECSSSLQLAAAAAAAAAASSQRARQHGRVGERRRRRVPPVGAAAAHAVARSAERWHTATRCWRSGCGYAAGLPQREWSSHASSGSVRSRLAWRARARAVHVVDCGWAPRRASFERSPASGRARGGDMIGDAGEAGRGSRTRTQGTCSGYRRSSRAHRDRVYMAARTLG